MNHVSLQVTKTSYILSRYLVQFPSSYTCTKICHKNCDEENFPFLSGLAIAWFQMQRKMAISFQGRLAIPNGLFRYEWNCILYPLYMAFFWNFVRTFTLNWLFVDRGHYVFASFFLFFLGWLTFFPPSIECLDWTYQWKHWYRLGLHCCCQGLQTYNYHACINESWKKNHSSSFWSWTGSHRSRSRNERSCSEGWRDKSKDT